MKNYFKNSANTAPILVLAVMILLFTSRFIDSALLTRDNEYVAVIVLQLVIFLMPAAFYIRALGLDFTRFRISIFGPGHLLLLISGLIALTSGTILIDSYTLGDSAFAANYDLWGVFISKNEGTAQSSLYLILAYAALPALCEEFDHLSAAGEELEKVGIAPRSVNAELRIKNIRITLKAHLVIAAARSTVNENLATSLLHRGKKLLNRYSASDTRRVPISTIIHSLTLNSLKADISHLFSNINDGRIDTGRSHTLSNIVNILLVSLAYISRKRLNLNAGIKKNTANRLRIKTARNSNHGITSLAIY